jgi:alpha-mannosidase
MWVLDENAAITEISDGTRRGFRVEKNYLGSKIVQKIWLYSESRRIDFETELDWHEHHQILKAAFPLDVQTDSATYEIQYGHVRRPTHENTSWDKAKFEVYGHKWADLSEGGYGVAILNDCKYGYDIHDSLMQISLFKTPTSPNEIADQGEIVFTYSLCPHAGTLADSNIPALAYDLNNPMFAIEATGVNSVLPEEFSMVTSSAENLLCEVIKEAEDSDATILRFYESKNMKTTAEITLGMQAEHCYLCDLMENELEELPIVKGKVTVNAHGFEILTLKVK